MKQGTRRAGLVRWGGALALALVSAVCLVRAAVARSRTETLNALAREQNALKRRFDAAKLQFGPLPGGAAVSREHVTAAVIGEFLPYVQEDLNHGETGRAASELSSLEVLLNRVRHPAGVQPRGISITYESAATGRQAGRRLGFEARGIRARSSLGAPVESAPPVFLTGYGYYKRVRDDVQRFPGMGANLIQAEIGPRELFPERGVVDRSSLDNLVQTLDRAAEAGVAVDVLLAPHYFPDWILRSVPGLRQHREGFVQFCIHHPAGREFLRQYVHTVIREIKDHPALLSVCLANEPVNIEEPCPEAKRSWKSWLAARHGSLDGFAQAHDTALHDFDAVPLPDPFHPPADRSIWLDFVRFNQEQLAEWFGVLASAVHEIAPDLPVHVKALGPVFLSRMGDPAWGVDPTLLAQLKGPNGNDGLNFYQYGSTDFAQSWQETSMAADLQRSLNSAPVFNSENHLIPDYERREVPAKHIRTALWQAAVHGQSATVIWVWERTFDPKIYYWGSILERPDAVEAVGHTNLDLNRAALELAILQQAPFDVAILSSTSAIVWDTHVSRVTEALYTALSFTGLKPGFVTERQLETGSEPSVSTLFIPGNVHLSRAAIQCLSRYTGRLVFIGGSELLTRDDHDQASPAKLVPAEIIGQDHAESWRQLWPELLACLIRWRAASPVQVTDERGAPIWGVEWRSAQEASGRWVVNLCNYRHEPLSIQLLRGGHVARGIDVLSGLRLPPRTTLQSLETRLIRLD